MSLALLQNLALLPAGGFPASPLACSNHQKVTDAVTSKTALPQGRGVIRVTNHPLSAARTGRSSANFVLELTETRLRNMENLLSSLSIGRQAPHSLKSTAMVL